MRGGHAGLSRTGRLLPVLLAVIVGGMTLGILWRAWPLAQASYPWKALGIGLLVGGLWVGYLGWRSVQALRMQMSEDAGASG